MDEGAAVEEETLKLVLLLLAVPFMCCCSFWAAKLRSTRLMEETWREGRGREREKNGNYYQLTEEIPELSESIGPFKECE